MRTAGLVLLTYLAFGSIVSHASNYTCHISYNREFQIQLDADLKAGKIDEVSFTAGRPFELSNKESCIKFKNKGLCLLGPNDPYELCQIVCKEMGFKIDTANVQAFDKFMLKFDVTSKTFTKKYKPVDAPSSRSYECLREDIVTYDSKTSVVLDNGEVYIYSKNYSNTAQTAKLPDQEMNGQNITGTKTVSVLMRNFAQRIESGELKLVDLSDTSKKFNIRKVKKAVCKSAFYTSDKYDLQIENSALVLKDGSNYTTHREDITGEIVEAGGTSQIALDGKLIPVSKITEKDFTFNKLVCHVEK